MLSDDDLTLDDDQVRPEIERLQSQNAHLQEALKSTRTIGAAVGIIMATMKLTYEQGFEYLTITSQHHNLKLRALAERIVFTGEIPPIKPPKHSHPATADRQPQTADGGPMTTDPNDHSSKQDDNSADTKPADDAHSEADSRAEPNQQDEPPS